MKITINLRDAKSNDPMRFWFAQVDEDCSVPVKRFGFRMFLRDLETDGNRLATECATRMRWAKGILRAEEIATMRKNYQAMHDCKSHRAIGSAERQLDARARTVKEIVEMITM